MKLTPLEIIREFGGEIGGNGREVWLTGFANLRDAGPTDLSFYYDGRYEAALYETKAGAVLLPKGFTFKEGRAPQNVVWIYVDRPEHVFYTLVKRYKAPPLPPFGREAPNFVHPEAQVSERSYIGAFAYVGAGAIIEDEVYIYPYAYVGNGAVIGAGTIVYPHAVVMPGVRIGKECIIHPGAVIGADGFGFYKGDVRPYERIPQVGTVVLEDAVEVGANTCIDRSTLGETRIEEGVKLDNLIQVGHNVRIGRHTAIAAQTGIAGSSRVGAYCRIGGQVGIADHVEVADHSSIAAQSGVSKSITVPGRSWRGSPAQEVRRQLLMEAIMRKLPDLYPAIQKLEQLISQTQ
jgi:UDP-3-O-[3-hydroxymyristoyl] glucosamine N-acyltransferase